jgi:tripartite-type tricarboxylate transporter receptor subunit TctC
MKGCRSDDSGSTKIVHHRLLTRPRTRRDLLGFAVIGGAAALAPAPARSQEQRYPARTIRIIVPFPAGATTDMLARLFAQRMTEGLGQTVVVENVGGAGGSLGADQVAKAASDGYTLLFHNITFTTTTTSLQHVARSKHDIEQDFVPISVGAYVPFWLLAHPSVPARNLEEFVGFARRTKDPLFYGSTGPGSIMNLVGEVLKRDARIKMDHVPFRGAAPLVTEMLSGRIQFGGDQLSSSLQHVRSGALKAMAVATRSAAMPDVPTVRELGFPNLELQGWNGFLAPRGTPESVVARLQQEVAAAASHPEVRKRMTDVGAEPSGSTQAEMRAMLRDQISKVKPLVEELKLVVQ